MQRAKGYAKMTIRQALGKGLEALIPIQGDTESLTGAFPALTEIPIDRVYPNPFQPRQEFDPQELQELSDSIREKGVVQPVIVRQRPDGQFELIAGERRLRASKLAGLAQIPAVVREMTDNESLEVALIENIQRSDLNAVEEAVAYQRLMDQFNLTQEEMAKKVGKDRASIANTLRLLKLPAAILNLVQEGKLSEGHARTLLGLESEEEMQKMADRVMRDSLSVRETERQIQEIRPEPVRKSKPRKSAEGRDPHLRTLEEELRRKLTTQVRVIPKGASKGKIEIDYYSLEDLDRVLALIG